MASIPNDMRGVYPPSVSTNHGAPKMKRQRMSKAKSRSLFTNTAKSPHPKNVRNTVMRGGYRL